MERATGPILPDTDAGLERIKRLEEQLASWHGSATERRGLAQAVRIEADLYRRSLDTRQAAATLSKKAERTIKRLV
jgi:hypothetical protein